MTRELLDPSFAMFKSDEETNQLFFNPHTFEIGLEVGALPATTVQDKPSSLLPPEPQIPFPLFTHLVPTYPLQFELIGLLIGVAIYPSFGYSSGEPAI